MKVGASHTPSQTYLPLTSRSPRSHRWVPSHSPTVSCAYRAAGWRQPLPTRSPSMPSSARAADPACRRAEALEVRYPAAGGVGEEASSASTPPVSAIVRTATWQDTNPAPLQQGPLGSLDEVEAVPSQARGSSSPTTPTYGRPAREDPGLQSELGAEYARPHGDCHEHAARFGPL